LTVQGAEEGRAGGDADGVDEQRQAQGLHNLHPRAEVRGDRGEGEAGEQCAGGPEADPAEGDRAEHGTGGDDQEQGEERAPLEGVDHGEPFPCPRPAPGRRAVRAGTAVWTAPHDSPRPGRARSGVVRGHGVPRRFVAGRPPPGTGNIRHAPDVGRVMQDTAVQCAEGIRVPTRDGTTADGGGHAALTHRTTSLLVHSDHCDHLWKGPPWLSPKEPTTPRTRCRSPSWSPASSSSPRCISTTATSAG